jgi:hypothetical protein
MRVEYKPRIMFLARSCMESRVIMLTRVSLHSLCCAVLLAGCVHTFIHTCYRHTLAQLVPTAILTVADLHDHRSDQERQVKPYNPL